MNNKEKEMVSETYEDVMAEVNEKVGKRPPMPKDLAPGDWSEQGIKVLKERYLDKNSEGEIIETPDELVWRVAFIIASAEARFGASIEEITETAKLTDDDFIPETGEPKLRQSTDDKIRSLGLLYCASGEVTKGGAFGNFTAEPSTGAVSNFQGVSSDAELGRYYSIVDNLDNITDSNSDQFAGSVPFTNGWRWNHHWYCK